MELKKEKNEFPFWWHRDWRDTIDFQYVIVSFRLAMQIYRGPSGAARLEGKWSPKTQSRTQPEILDFLLITTNFL